MFIHTARGVSREVRSFVRTFDLSQFYRENGVNSRGRKVFEQCDEIFDDFWFMSRTLLFPSLQFAIMDGVPHSYMIPGEPYPPKSLTRHVEGRKRLKGSEDELASSSTSSDERTTQAGTTKTCPLLFSAQGCPESGRYSLLDSINTSNLMYLDLSYTKRDSRYGHILPSLATGFPNLRVLKLRGLGIIDAEFSRLTQTDGRLWSLDLTNNLLTDAVVIDLTSSRFMLNNIPAKKSSIRLPDQDLFEDVPDYQRDVNGEKIDTTAPLRPDVSEKFMKHIKTHSSFPSINDQILDLNDPLVRQTGITHLYISKNRFTSSGVNLILNQANRLQVLDAGTVEAVNSDGLRPNYAPYTTTYSQLGHGSVYNVSHEARSRMEYLHIHHSFVTYVPTILRSSEQNHRFSLELVRVAENSGLARLQAVSVNKAFSPLQNYRITSLTLTSIPTKSYGLTIERLIEFLGECKIQEERLNEARKFTEKSRRSPQLLPGLRTLRLEFLPEDTSPLSPDGGSVSGDRDADTFLASSEGDFSFFDDPNTMSSVSRRGSVATTGGGSMTGPSTPASRRGSVMGGGATKRAISTLPRPGSSESGAASPAPPAYKAEVKDVIQELRKYRSQKAGKWTGDLQLVFPYGR